MSPPRCLLLMRHARPLPPGQGPDLARELSVEGWAQARRVGESLRGQDAPGLIFSSPATRCLQTAHGVRDGLAAATASGANAASPEILVRPALGFDDPSVDLNELESAGASVLIVSHHPTLVGLGAALLGRGAKPVDLRPGQLAILRGAPGAWVLEGLLDSSLRR